MEIEKQIREALDRGDADEALRLGAILDEEDAERRVRLSSTAPISAALWYAEHGIAVFPILPRGKRPLTEHGFEDASADPDQIRDWWRHNPDANIGAPTGHTFDVVDIDGVDGIASWAEHYEELATITIGHASTPRPGGNHLFIRPTGQGNRTKIYPGIDYRGAGGYVLLPPSVTDEHGPGLIYRWIRHLDVTALERT